MVALHEAVPIQNLMRYGKKNSYFLCQALEANDVLILDSYYPNALPSKPTMFRIMLICRSFGIEMATSRSFKYHYAATMKPISSIGHFGLG